MFSGDYHNIKSSICQVSERPLKDNNKLGKDRNWKGRKLQNIEYAKRLEILGYKAFSNVYQCAEVLKFRELDGNLKLHQAWFCKSRLCPICNWRRSMKYSTQLAKIVDLAIARKPKAKFLFLTLTVKNVDGVDLKNSLKDLSKSFKRLFERKKIKQSVIGYFKAVEVTYNDKTDTFHPHIHVLLMVNAGYFKKKELYITQEEWKNMWKQSAKLDYMPIVDIRKVQPNNKFGEKSIRSAIVETAKYPVKPIEILSDDEETKLKITKFLLEGMKQMRLVSYGALFKELKKELHLDDVENGDLVHIDDENEESSLGVEIVAIWNWERKNYFIVD